jgi:hypothetical protein
LAVENAIVPSISPLQSFDIGDVHYCVKNEHQSVHSAVTAAVELPVVEMVATAAKHDCLEKLTSRPFFQDAKHHLFFGDYGSSQIGPRILFIYAF